MLGEPGIGINIILPKNYTMAICAAPLPRRQPGIEQTARSQPRRRAVWHQTGSVAGGLSPFRLRRRAAGAKADSSGGNPRPKPIAVAGDIPPIRQRRTAIADTLCALCNLCSGRWRLPAA
jgi:hypothetical protein